MLGRGAAGDVARGRPPPSDYARLYAGLFALAAICLSWLPFALAMLILLRGPAGRGIGRRAITYGFRLYIAFLGLIGACRFDLTELDKLRGAGPLILAPNHPSLLDAVMIISRLPNVVCIMKASLMNNLFLGAGARLAGYIPNERPRQMVREARNSLARGAQLLLFPEGTRTARPPVNPILPTTGAIARIADVPVQTLIVEADSRFLAKGWPLYRCPRMPLNYRVRIGERFEPRGDGQPVSTRLEHYFRSALEQTTLASTSERMD